MVTREVEVAMRAIILAAGKGSRFGDVTRTTPKPLIVVAGKPLIRHVLDALPTEVTDCIVVIGHLGQLIQCELGTKYNKLGLRYVQQRERGTGGALLSAAELVNEDAGFLVVGSDDIFGKGELAKLLRERPTYGVVHGVPRRETTNRVVFDHDNVLVGFQTVNEPREARYFGAGAYVLPSTIFNETFYRLPNGELSIPHTLVHVSFAVEVVRLQRWLPVNSIQEKEEAERRLAEDQASGEMLW